LRTSKLINFTELGRLAGITSPTAKKFMRNLLKIGEGNNILSP
jgi:hypothetical protein